MTLVFVCHNCILQIRMKSAGSNFLQRRVTTKNLLVVMIPAIPSLTGTQDAPVSTDFVDLFQ